MRVGIWCTYECFERRGWARWHANASPNSGRARLLLLRAAHWAADQADQANKARSYLAARICGSDSTRYTAPRMCLQAGQGRG